MFGYLTSTKTEVKENKEMIRGLQYLGTTKNKLSNKKFNQVKQLEDDKHDKSGLKLLKASKLVDEYDSIPCRICLEEKEDKISGQLGNFCNCKGSISKVHVNCLQIQLQLLYKGQEKMEKLFQNKCELCQAQYRLNISKKVCLNKLNHIQKQGSQRIKTLCFFAFISILSFHISYMVNKQVREFKDQKSLSKETESTKLIINPFLQNQEFNCSNQTDTIFKEVPSPTPMNRQFKEGVQIALGYILIGFFFAIGFLSVITFSYHIIIVSLYIDVYISNKKMIRPK